MNKGLNVLNVYLKLYLINTCDVITSAEFRKRRLINKKPTSAWVPVRKRGAR